MVVFAQIAAVLVYLAPVALVAVLAARRERRLDELAALIPATVAVDIVAVLVLCRLMRLEWAAIVSRVLWVAGAALWFDRRQRRLGLRPARPAALDRRALIGIALGVLLAVGLSMALSRPYAIWDREWHIPFVASVRGQQIPFSSAYEPGITFHYHFSGDVFASMLQVFSFDVMNASLALSLAHDVMFGLIAITLSLALLASGPRPVHVVVLAVGAVLLSGPCVLRFGVGEPYLGYSYYALYIWGFRPHQSLAMLMYVGLATVLFDRGSRRADAPPASPVGVRALVAMMTLLPVTDEASAGVLGACLGIAWLLDPTLLASTRRRGAVLLAGLAVAFIGTNLLFAASIAPGTLVQKLTLVAPRSPGVQQPPLPLSGGPGWVALIADTLQIWTIFLALALLAVRRREGAGRPSRGLMAFAAALLLISIAGLTTIDMNGAAPESHRFLTAALFMFPVFGVLAFDWWPPGTGGRALVLAALILGAGSTALWRSHYPRHPTPETYFRQRGPNLHTSNCRELAGARFGQKPEITYIESSVHYAYTGCRPSFAAGRIVAYWNLKQYPTFGLPALVQLNKEMVAPDASVDAVCPAGRRPGDVDPVCTYALARTNCTPDGSAYLRCPLSPADRKAILGAR